MYKRGKTMDPDKQQQIDIIEKHLGTIGLKKWVRYDEGARIYSIGIQSFMQLAKEAGAVYHIRRMCLVNTEKLDEYIEMAYGSTPDNEEGQEQ